MGTKMITTILEIYYNEKKIFVKKISKKVKMPKMVLKFATEQNIDFGHIGPAPSTRYFFKAKN